MYGNFAVWALQDREPVWADGAQSRLLTRVSRSMRLKVLRREAAHYVVRLPDMRQGYVAVNAVAAAPVSPASDMLRREEPRHTGVQAEFVRASYARRIIARFVDSIILWTVLGVPVGVAAGAGNLAHRSDDDTVTLSSGAAVLMALGFAGLGFVYEWAGTAAGGTPGKALLKISIVDAESGRSPGMWKSFVRFGAQYAVSTLLGLPILMLLLSVAAWAPAHIWWAFGGAFVVMHAPYIVAFANNGKTLYDVVAGTWVVEYR
jgi:hypothetical protein